MYPWFDPRKSLARVGSVMRALPGVFWNALVVQRKEAPTFASVISLVFVVGLIVGCFSFAVNRSSRSQIQSQEATLSELRNEGNTIRGELTQIRPMLNVIAAERMTPHPALADRDAQLIGGHVDISWSDNSQAKFAQPIYIISLLGLGGSKHLPGQKVTRCSTEDPTSSETGSGCEELFVASDSVHRTTRIPTDAHQKLKPGHYVWRVAAASAGYMRTPDPEIGLLSKWSNYGSFTLYQTLSERIADTRQVLVGVNLEQNSTFARNVGGDVEGTDVTIVKMLVRGCLALPERSPRYNQQSCERTASNATKCLEMSVGEKRSSCIADAPGPSHALDVRFVSIPAWGDWQMALRRKEIDLFIGGVTAAGAREGAGIKFVGRGYDAYRTHLYIHKSDLIGAGSSVLQWTSAPRTVGVISNSSNEALLDIAIDVRCKPLLQDRYRNGPTANNACPLKKVQFKDYPELDKGMDSGALDGVLIDDPFVVEDEWNKSPDMQTFAPEAWIRYEHEFLREYASPDHREHLSFPAAYDGSQGEGSLLKELSKAMSSKSMDAFMHVAVEAARKAQAD